MEEDCYLEEADNLTINFWRVRNGPQPDDD